MRGKPLLVTVWAAGVLATSFATWQVIDAAGKQILADAYQPAYSTELTPAPTRTSTVSPSDSTSPTKTGSKDPGKDSGGVGTHSSGPQPTQTTTQNRSATKSWRLVEGTVVATCTGSTLNSSATPNEGYGVQVDNGEPVQDKVHFEPKGDRGSEVTLLVTCKGGTPQISDQAGDSEGGGSQGGD